MPVAHGQQTAAAATQLAPAPVAASGGAVNEEPVALSPFEVNTARNKGFVAATSLAGTRLMTDLKDTPAAYSVITSEFIQAAGITDLNKATNWTVGAFYSPDNNTNQGFGIIQFSVIRGTAPGQSQYATRNYFPDNVIFDSYNVEQYEYGRGSNSILFGSSAFGGNANVATKQAQLNRSIGTLSASYGSWGQARTTVDVNQPVGSHAAVRADVMWQHNDPDDWRQYNTMKKKAAFLTGTWEPFKDTQVRLDGEYGEMSQILGLTTLTDQISGWDGKTTFATTPVTPLTTAQKNAAGVSQQGLGYVYNPAGGSSAIINYQNVPTTISGGAVDAVNGNTSIGGVKVVGDTNIQTGAPMLFSQNLPAGRYGTDLSGSPFFYIPKRAFSMNWNNQPTSTQNYKNATLTLDHHVGDSLYFQVAGELSKETWFGNNAVNRGSETAFIDLDQTLPTGAPNPEYLKPYSQVSQYNEPRWVDFRNLRAAAAYIKDTPAGKLTFNTLAGMQWQRNENRAYFYVLPLTSDLRAIPLASGSYNVNYRWYWDQVNRSLADFNGPVTVIDPVTPANNKTVTPTTVLDTSRADNNSSTHTNYKYLQGSITDKLWGGKLVLFGAARRDFYQFQNRGTIAPMDYPVGWNGQNLIFKPDAPSNYFNLMYFPKAANGTITGPLQPAITRPRTGGVAQAQYANDKFQSDYNPPALNGAINTLSFGGVYNVTPWLGIYADTGQTFTLPQANAVSFSLQLLPPTVSKSYDAGLRFHLLDGRLEMTLGGYQSRNRNAEVGGLGISSFNSIYALAPTGDTTAANQNALGISQLPSVIFDTVDQSNRGLEFELTANLTKNWRLMFNATESRTYQNSPDASFLAYHAAQLQSLKKILATGGVAVDANNFATVTNPGDANNTGVHAGQATAAANAWNTLEGSTIPGVVSGRTEFVGSMQTRTNIFTDYSFTDGLLHGFRIGGGLQYFGKEVLGSDASERAVSPTDPTKSILVGDPYKMIYSKPYVLGTATLGYEWRINKRRSIDFRLVINNLFNYSSPIYYVNVPGSNANDLALRPPGGNVTSAARIPTPNNYYYEAPRNYMLTATVNF